MRRRAAGLLLLALVGGACGNRLTHQEITSAALGSRSTGAVATADTAAQGAGTTQVPNGLAAADGTGAASVAAGPARRTGDNTGRRPASPLEPVAASTDRGSSSPIKIGNVGIYSGVAGGPFVGTVQAVRAWTRDVNARGGINGHLVEFFVIDDGLDPARHRAGIQKLVEQDHVIAFVGNTETVTGPGMIEYHKRVRVPVIGSDSGSPHYYRSTMHFPEVSNANPKFLGDLGSAAAVAIPQGLTRFATITCTEAASCGDADRVYASHASDFGMHDVYRARSSIAQPDYTAECLQARNNQAQVIITVLDAPSQGRVALACARQGYKPLIVGSTATAAMEQDPRLDGLVFGSGAFPWVSSDTPARAEFQRVMHTYAPNATFGSGATLGWTAAKMFEKAAADMPEPPSNEVVLRGLWSFRDDDLGGLTYPLSFFEGRPAEQKSCAFPMQIKNGHWTALGDGKVHCFKY